MRGRSGKGCVRGGKFMNYLEIMVKQYTAEALEREFKTVARVRIRGKERGKQEYAGDAGY